MNSIILDGGSPTTCFPLTCTRPLSDCTVANRPLADAQAERLAGAGVKLVERAAPGKLTLFMCGAAWLSRDCVRALVRAGRPAVLVDVEGLALAWLNTTPGRPARGAMRIPADNRTFMIRYPWDLLRINEELVGAIATDAIEGSVSPHAHIDGRIVVGSGSKILPGVSIEGNVVIGSNAIIGPNCYLRGSTSIGDGCHIGHAVEIKNSIIMNRSSIGHLSYCGDSIIGEGVNFGAGTITANFRHDGAEHRSHVGGRLIATGRRKFGTVVGDHVHTGIHTSIYPGRKIWPGLTTRPGDVVRTDLRGTRS